jgi:hypothetical protein
MQDKYTGDIGDFGKYGLLNEICRKSNWGVRLGINWFFVTKEEKGGGDGKYIDYLRSENKDAKKYWECFPELYDRLKSMVYCRRKRSIQEIEKGLILPKETVFYSEPIPYSSINPFKREEDRENWFEESLTKLKNADIIFLDPDNGIQTDKVKKAQIKAIKYVFKDEIKQYYELGKSLIIYTHRDRKPEPEYNRKLMAIREPLKTWNGIKVLKFKRVSVRHYVFLIQKEHQDLMEETISCLIREPYSFLFGPYALD